MKMSKIKIAVLVLLTVVVTVAVLPLMNVAYDEFYFKPWYESLTPIKKEYAHPTPFFATWYGFGTIAVWACLGFVWLTYLIVKLKQSRNFHLFPRQPASKATREHSLILFGTPFHPFLMVTLVQFDGFFCGFSLSGLYQVFDGFFGGFFRPYFT